MTAVAIAAGLSFCARLQLAQLNASPFCRARLWIQPAQSLCIDEDLWQKHLREPLRYSLCGNWQGRWKNSSPPENSGLPTSRANELFSSSSKTVFSTFYADHLPTESPQAPALKQALLQLMAWIEERRLWLSQALAPNDPFGICRKLLLGETGSSAPRFLRTLGFMHILGATGIYFYACAMLWNLFLRTVLGLLGIPVSSGLWLRRALVIAFLGWAWALAGAPRRLLLPLGWMLFHRTLRFAGIRARTSLLLVIFSSGALAIFGGISGALPFLCSLAGVMLARRKGRSSLTGMSLSAWLLTSVSGLAVDRSIYLATPLISLLTLPLLCWIVYPSLGIASLFRVSGLAAETASWTHQSTLHLLRIFLPLPLLWGVPLQALVLAIFPASIIALSFGGEAGVRKSEVALAAFLLASAVFIRNRPPPAELSPRASWVSQLDVGQGDAAWVRAESDSSHSGWSALIDAGSPGALSETQWIRILAESSSNQLDWIGLTHLDEDHSGGVKRLAGIVPIGLVMSSSQELATPRGAKFTQELAGMGIPVMPWNPLKMPIPFLPPAAEKSAKKMKNKNMSAVLVPFSGGGFYLSAGDADQEAELRIGAWVKHQTEKGSMRLLPHILKISHHGSASSSAPGFLAEVSPSVCWISVGLGNPYGHPTPRALSTLARLCPFLLRTDQLGTLGFRSLDSFFGLIFPKSH